MSGHIGRGGRIYKYKIEGSEDGKNWKMLADQSSNSIAATSEGVPFKFNPQTVRYVKITFLGNTPAMTREGTWWKSRATALMPP